MTGLPTDDERILALPTADLASTKGVTLVARALIASFSTSTEYSFIVVKDLKREITIDVNGVTYIVNDSTIRSLVGDLSHDKVYTVKAELNRNFEVIKAEAEAEGLLAGTESGKCRFYVATDGESPPQLIGTDGMSKSTIGTKLFQKLSGVSEDRRHTFEPARQHDLGHGDCDALVSALAKDFINRRGGRMCNMLSGAPAVLTFTRVACVRGAQPSDLCFTVSYPNTSEGSMWFSTNVMTKLANRRAAYARAQACSEVDVLMSTLYAACPFCFENHRGEEGDDTIVTQAKINLHKLCTTSKLEEHIKSVHLSTIDQRIQSLSAGARDNLAAEDEILDGLRHKREQIAAFLDIASAGDDSKYKRSGSLRAHEQQQPLAVVAPERMEVEKYFRALPLAGAD